MNEGRWFVRFAMLAALGPAVAGAAPGDTTADRVLGQTNFTTSTAQNPATGGLNGPTVTVIDPSNRLYVVDQLNHRVLGWANAATFANGAVPDLIIGQPDAASVTCNQGVAPNASTLCNPIGAAVDPGGNLYVADAFNNRVLGYASPFTTDAVADLVFGHGGNFSSAVCNEGGVGATSLCFPVAVVTDFTGNVFVKDAANHRVLAYFTPFTADTTADVVFGQLDDFTTNECNGPGLGPSALCASGGLAFGIDDDLFVADAGNNRVLKFDQPLDSDTVADAVIGQSSFTENLCNGGGDPTASTICDPSSLAILGTHLLVADAGNNRVLLYRDVLTIDIDADLVFGQNGSFTTNGCNNPSPDSLCAPTGVAVDVAGNVYIADQTYNRVLAFDDPLAVIATPTPTSTPIATPTSTPSATPTATGTAGPGPTATATAAPGPTATATAGPAPTATGTAAPGPTATPALPRPPTPTVRPGATPSEATTDGAMQVTGSEDEVVTAGRFELHNRSSDTVAVSCVSIDFERPAAFDTAIVLGAFGSFNRRAKAVAGRPSLFCFDDPLSIARGGTATFELTVGLIDSTSAALRRRIVLASVVPQSGNAPLDALVLVFLAAAALPSKRARVLAVACALAALAFQTSCGDDDDAASGGATRATSTQRLIAVDASGPRGPFTFTGLPLTLGIVEIPAAEG